MEKRILHFHDEFDDDYLFETIFYFYYLLLYITKVSPCLTSYRLKGKKGVGHLALPP